MTDDLDPGAPALPAALGARGGGWNVGVTEAERAARIDACTRQLRDVFRVREEYLRLRSDA